MIIGNGITGVTAAEILRSQEPTSAITVIADDPFPVYYRPALKDYLAGHMPEEKLWARPNTFYAQQHVRFIPEHVVGIRAAEHFVQLHNGQQVGYSKLLLANGARSRQLSCPGLHLTGVSTLRSVADYQQILRYLDNVQRVMVYGSGTLALESAEILHQRGYEVAHLLRNSMLWSEILDATASDMVLQEERRAGIDVRTGEEIREIVGKNGQVTGIITTSGKRIPCELVLIAIGIEPLVDFIAGSGIVCGRGVKVDDEMHTSAVDVYAAGDVIETTDALTGQVRVLGQWYPAIQQARAAAYSMLNMLDRSRPFHSSTFYNATFLYGLDFVSIGLTKQVPSVPRLQEFVAKPEPRNYRKVLLQDGVPVGALLLGERKNALALKRAIDHRIHLGPVLDSLFDEGFELDAWLNSQHVPPAILQVSKQERGGTSGNQSGLSKTQFAQAMEGWLVPVPHLQVPVAVTETSLSSTGTITIGRQQEATLLIDHASVSRYHAEITAKDGQYQLCDKGSTNGTFVNNARLGTHRVHTLQQGERVRFGDVQFRFELRQAALEREQAEPVVIGVGSQKSTLSMQMHQETTRITNLAQRATALLPATQVQDTHTHGSLSRLLPAATVSGVQDTPALIFVTRPGEVQTIPLEYGKSYTLGRDRDNDIVLEDTAVSRKHAEIYSTAEGFAIRDMGSSNGIFVNKVKVNTARQLVHEDRIVIGNVLIYVVLPQASTQQGTLAQDMPTGRSTIGGTQGAPESRSVVVGLGHRRDIRPLTKDTIHFEIDMCIGCDRCMEACPVPMSAQINIADLNQATISDQLAPHVVRFTHECIMCGSCVPVCPVDNHRDLLMLSLKQQIGTSWDGLLDLNRLTSSLPTGWTLPMLIGRLREQAMLNNAELVPENYLLHMVTASKILFLSPGTTLVHEGEYGRDLYLILEGRVAISASQTREQELPLAILGHGEYVGEYGLLTGQQQHVTARTQTSALVLQVPEQVLQRLMELVPQVRRYFEQANNTRSIESILKRMSLFQGVADADIRGLIAQTQVKQYERNERLFAEDTQCGQQPTRETLHILLEGFVKVARHTTAGTGQHKTDERIIAYRQGGDYFAGGLDLLGDGRAVTVTTITRARVAEVPRYGLLALFQRYPEVQQRFTVRLQEYIDSTVATHSDKITAYLSQHASPISPPSPAVKAGLHSLVSDGVVEGTEVLVIDLDMCIHCNECEEACKQRHGHSRMNRKGMVVGNISIATACRQCQDPVCMLCSRAGIARRPNGEVYITESCIGCGICAERCPYGAISIINVGEEPVESHTSWQRFSEFLTKGIQIQGIGKERGGMDSKRAIPGPLDTPIRGYDEMRKKLAIKCDLCAGYKDQACVEACPTGAAVRVQPTKFFGSTEEILQRRVF